MTNYVLSIDPGLSTGVALIGYEPDTAPELVAAWQFSGGLFGLLGWTGGHWHNNYFDPYHDAYTEGYVSLEHDDDPRSMACYTALNPKMVTAISEKFTARNTRGFSYTTASLEPLRGEGALIALGVMPDYSPKERRWRDPSLQYLVGGKDLPDKKRRQHAFLKDIGFYRTNKDFPDSPSKDGADDFRSAAAHGLAYLAREVKHKPTIKLLEDWIS